MRNSAKPLIGVLLAPVLLASAASRLSAAGDPVPTTEKNRTVVIGPEKRILVDGDRVVVLDDEDQNMDIDPVIVGDLPDFDDLPRVVRFHGHRAGGYLGVRSIEMTPELRQHFGAPRDTGVLVGTVEPDSPAAKAGIQVGDILTAVDGDEVGSTRDLSRSVRRHKAGDAVKVDLLRERAKKTLTVTIQQSEGKGDREDFRVGEFGHGPHGFAWKDWERSWRDWDHGDFATPAVPPVPPVPANPNGSRWLGLEDRMKSLEQRLKELEGRLPTQPPR